MFSCQGPGANAVCDHPFELAASADREVDAVQFVTSGRVPAAPCLGEETV